MLMPTRYGAVVAVLAVAMQLAGCGQNASEQTSDIGSNPPPVEFQAACLRLARGAVVSFTHTPTLGVVLRTMSLKDHMRVRWERVSDNSWIQRIEGTDPLTGKATEAGLMFERVQAAPTSECPNGSVLLARMVVNGNELAPAVMNDGFVSMLNVAALNTPTANARTAPQSEPALPQPDPETGCYDGDCPVTGSYIPEGSGDPSAMGGNHPPSQGAQRRANSLSQAQKTAVDSWMAENHLCRGSSNEGACERRQVIGSELRADGLCYGHSEDRGGVDFIWHVCEPGSDR